MIFAECDGPAGMGLLRIGKEGLIGLVVDGPGVAFGPRRAFGPVGRGRAEIGELDEGPVGTAGAIDAAQSSLRCSIRVEGMGAK